MTGFGQVAVVGAGWAGLACAAELAAAEIPVTVFEASRQLGGRARSVELDGRTLDNGQHLLVGAYVETLRLMRLVGAAPDALLLRMPLRLDYPGAFRLALPRLPAPWHLAAGLLAADGASLREKLSAAAFMQRLKASGFRLDRDTTVAAWLDRHRQHGAIRRFLWEPLCLAALNTPPQHASAQVFANVLRDSLGGPRDATDLLVQRADLGRVFPEQAGRYLGERGGRIRCAHRIREIERSGNGWRVAGEHFEHVVLAVAPQHVPSLLVSRPAHEPLLRLLADYDYEPIGTAYLAYPEPVRLPFPMLGLRGPLGQWVFDRSAQGGPAGLLAFVLSADGDWEKLDDEELATSLHAELTATVGPLPPPHWQRSIRERRATFRCRPDLPRPGPATAERGLWLAGDYTCGEYPATLEGAVRSGVAAARAVLAGK
ncbi:MAG: FAD-dependent oxidoreductase [Rhodocyclales bacterium]|nr:FAD-dependent oxidoreductase [Rhodocyclales bacterium]